MAHDHGGVYHGRAFAVGVGSTLAFVIIEVTYGLRGKTSLVTATLWLLLLLRACAGEVEQRAATGSTSAEISLLQYLIEHEWTIGELLRRAQERDLTATTSDALKHAETHSSDNHAALIRARQNYPGGMRDPVTPPREHEHRVDQYQGAEYEREVLRLLAEHYEEEVAVVDSTLPRIRADSVRALVQRIRGQRLEDIQELTSGR